MKYLPTLIIFSAFLNLCSCFCGLPYYCNQAQAAQLCGWKSSCIIKPCLLGNHVTCQCSVGGIWPHCVECTQNSQCPYYQACIGNTCRDPCSGVTCVAGSTCKAQNQAATCNCNPGLYGDSYGRCVACVFNSHCPYYLACIDYTCRDPCSGVKCVAGSTCQVKNQAATCNCNPGLYGDSYGRCVACVFNSHCPYYLACIGYTCRDPCSGVKCVAGSTCQVKNQAATCNCNPGLYGDSYGRCVACVFNSHCPYYLACVGNTCSDPCKGKSCGEGAKCDVINHEAKCSCINGYGDPNVRCAQCTSASHCPSNQACVGNTCKDPCIGVTCVEGATCKVTNQTATCYCNAGLYRNSYGRCVTCDSDSHCPYNQACIGNTCRDPCIGKSCGEGAKCEVINHEAKCSCINGYGDPNVRCVQCTSNSHCPYHQACVGNTCSDPCKGKSCGEGAKCDVINDEAKCWCINGYGDPNVRCVQCTSNSHCPSNQACVGNTCSDPCNGKSCGEGAKCDVINHEAKCSCATGYGDANVKCVECVSDSHCGSDKACIGNSCKDPCNGKSCGEGAKCDVINHEAKCWCINGYGDPNVRCEECMSDSHCGSDKACIGNSCKDPCNGKSCGEGAKCDVINHEANCSCATGYGDANVKCVECMSDSHCESDKACVSNACTDPCVGACGRDAVCKVMKHQAECSCPDDAFGDPHDECIKRKPEVP